MPFGFLFSDDSAHIFPHGESFAHFFCEAEEDPFVDGGRAEDIVEEDLPAGRDAAGEVFGAEAVCVAERAVVEDHAFGAVEIEIVFFHAFVEDDDIGVFLEGFDDRCSFLRGSGGGKEESFSAFEEFPQDAEIESEFSPYHGFGMRGKGFQEIIEEFQAGIALEGDICFAGFSEAAEDLLKADEEIEDGFIGKEEVFENFAFHVSIVIALFRSHFEMERFIDAVGESAAFDAGFLIDVRFDFSGEMFHIVSEDGDRWIQGGEFQMISDESVIGGISEDAFGKESELSV